MDKMDKTSHFTVAVLRAAVTTAALAREQAQHLQRGHEVPEEWAARHAQTGVLIGAIGVQLQTQRARQRHLRSLR